MTCPDCSAWMYQGWGNFWWCGNCGKSINFGY